MQAAWGDLSSRACSGCQVMIWDDYLGRCIGELSFRSQARTASTCQLLSCRLVWALLPASTALRAAGTLRKLLTCISSAILLLLSHTAYASACVSAQYPLPHPCCSLGNSRPCLQVRSVRLRRDKIVVALEHKVLVYNFADLRLLHSIETLSNPTGLLALSPVSDQTVLACPGINCGQVGSCGDRCNCDFAKSCLLFLAAQEAAMLLQFG